MIKVKPVDVVQRRYNKGVLKAYLKGRKTMNWVVGCFRNILMQEFDSIVLELSGYRNSPRYADISEIRRKLAEPTSTHRKTDNQDDLFQGI